MRLAVLLLTATLALPAFAQDQTDGEEARREAAENYVNSDSQQQILDQMLTPDAMVEQIRAMSPGVPDDVLTGIGQIAAEEMASIRPAMEQAMVEAAVETFTLEEIVAVHEFYETPEGASVMQKMQPYMQRAMTMLAPEMQEAQQRIMERGSELMQEQQ